MKTRTKDQGYWRDRWNAREIGFHQAGATPALVDLVDRVAPDPATRVLLPLCGKTKDLTFLAARGHQVTGVEWVETAIVELFAENELPHHVERVEGRLPRYVSERITAYAGDFFALSPSDSGRFDWAFDRGALVTFDEPDQPRYVRHLLDLLEPGGRILVIGFDYDPGQMSGPPSAVSGARIQQLFAGARRLERLAARDALDERFRQKGLTWLREEAWLIELGP